MRYLGACMFCSQVSSKPPSVLAAPNVLNVVRHVRPQPDGYWTDRLPICADAMIAPMFWGERNCAAEIVPAFI